jgi:GalNAc-alpha-(1->4)-GalNAc-alpha-(1->3)-diNAcBac-PP-undecaprenol alpha-1,4-N-acetyl-D-galactosaminyltransferase
MVAPQRITTVIAGLGGGGAERVCVNLANAWAAEGRQVTLLTITENSTGSVYPVDPEVERRDVGWPRASRAGEDYRPILDVLRQERCVELASELPMMAAIRAAIDDTAPDVIVSHMDLTNIRVLAAMHDRRIPLIACEHTDPHRVAMGPWEHPREVLYRRATAVVASHESTVRWFLQRGIAARCIANPLVPPLPRHIPRRARRRVVTLGRLAPEKRVEMLIRSFARVAQDCPEWDLEIYGTGPLEEHLARVIEEWSLGGRVTLCGFTHDPYGVLADADLYVSASGVEGYGNSVWEALASGVPVVAMECGAPVRTLVRDGIDGRIVTGGEQAFSATLAELMTNDPVRHALAARAAEAVTRYSFEEAMGAWDLLLNQVITARMAMAVNS